MRTPLPFAKTISALLFVAASVLTGHAQTPIFYGMTANGGTNGFGTVFSFNPATNAETVVHNFASFQPDGEYPQGNLVLDPLNNTLYGMTSAGGADGEGAIFSFNPGTGADTVVYSFAGIPDGGMPYGSLTYNPSDRLLYGMTFGGGSSYASSGVIFSFNPATPGVDSVRYRFSSPPDTLDAINPYGNLTYNSISQLFYGMGSSGGASGQGAIFSFAPSTNTETILHSFTVGADGRFPQGNLTYYQNTGEYYGLTRYGGNNGFGTIFHFDPSNNNEQTEYAFGAPPDADNPVSDLIFLGATGLFYGVTYDGGAYDRGAIFSFNPANNTENVVFNFDSTGTGPQAPVGNLVYDADNQLLYGMSYLGGASNKGTIYTFSPATYNVNTAWSFGADSDGAKPYSSLLLLNGPNGINAVSQQNVAVNIYPNPTTGAFTLTGLQPGQTVDVSNYLGQQVSRFTATGTATQQLDISTLEDGLYLLQVINADGTNTGYKKVVKQN